MKGYACAFQMLIIPIFRYANHVESKKKKKIKKVVNGLQPLRCTSHGGGIRPCPPSEPGRECISRVWTGQTLGDGRACVCARCVSNPCPPSSSDGQIPPTLLASSLFSFLVLVGLLRALVSCNSGSKCASPSSHAVVFASRKIDQCSRWWSLTRPGRQSAVATHFEN